VRITTSKPRSILSSSSSHPRESSRLNVFVAHQASILDEKDSRKSVEDDFDELGGQEEEFKEKERNEKEKSCADDSSEIEGVDSDLDGEPDREVDEERGEEVGIQKEEVGKRGQDEKELHDSERRREEGERLGQGVPSLSVSFSPSLHISMAT